MGAWKKLQPPPIPPHITGKTWVFSKLSHKNDAVCQDRACTIIGIQLVWKAASLELQPKPGSRLRALPPVQNSQGSERSKQVICSNSQRSRGTGHKTWHANPLFRFQSFVRILGLNMRGVWRSLFFEGPGLKGQILCFGIILHKANAQICSVDRISSEKWRNVQHILPPFLCPRRVHHRRPSVQGAEHHSEQPPTSAMRQL